MKYVAALLFLALGSFFFLQKKEKPTTGNKIKPIWADEFNYNGLPNSAKWSYDIGDGCPNVCGWGNNELQYYTDASKNARVENGHLIIEAHREDIGKKKYSSTRLVSRNKGDWKYGRIEVRAKLPTGLGTWPAIWMLPTDWEYGGWPESGEIDIMEHVGYSPDTIFGTVHTKAYNHLLGTHKAGEVYLPDAESTFHVYAVNWTAEQLDFYVDDNKYFTFRNEHKTFNEFPFDKKFHLIMNIAVGGNWGGKHGVAEDIWPQRMEVDYVRVYKDWQEGVMKSIDSKN